MYAAGFAAEINMSIIFAIQSMVAPTKSPAVYYSFGRLKGNVT